MRAATEQPLEAQALAKIERALHGKLRARKLSEDFIRRCAEDVIQKAAVEYLRAVQDGREIASPNAFIVDAAYKRALDELRRELRHADGDAAQTALATGSSAAPATEEIALENLRLYELRQAIETLSPEQRQVLSLYYFEERSAADGGRVLHLSENTFRRRLKKTLRILRRRLGVELPEPGSLPAIEIGLAAWTSIGGARVPVGAGPLEQAGAALAGVRDSLARLLGGGDGERVAVLFGGPAGKVAGGCAGAAVACVLGGVVGPGVGGIVAGGDHPDKADRAEQVGSAGSAERASLPRPEPAVAQPGEAPSQAAAPPAATQPQSRESRAERRAAARKSEARQLEAQASAATRVARESESAPTSDATESSAGAEPDAVVVVPSESSPTASQTAGEAAQTQQQFGAFK
ncbi:MAG: sigma-70 family RNA polymerase sigma factor [Thermoleophilia bacterium]|nr:sigma-70 family RNA polymerase sigma factor [Thermoleophilia bacterium]